MEKVDIFVSTNVLEHSRQTPLEDLGEVFGVTSEGEPNGPLGIDFPLYDESFPDADAKEPDYDEDKDDTEELSLLGRSLVQGVSLEQMGGTYRRVVYGPLSTDEQEEEAGCVPLGPKRTDMPEVIVLGRPDGNDKVKPLTGIYLSASRRRMSEGSAESSSP